VKRVSDIIGEITAASAEQSDGIGQINVSVTQLDQMTQQNAALVEQSAAAAESLKEQAAKLSQVVATFKLDAGSAVHAAPRPVVPAPAKPIAARKPPQTASAAPRISTPPRPIALPKPAAVAAGPAGAGDWETF
jgi:methyl-accepting chemotaxis protein